MGMNKQIRQLAEQAGFALWGEEQWNPGDVIDWSARYDRELEKFAKLIAGECAKLLPPEMTHGPDGRPLEQVFKQHFGVEE
jgi:hypothetical protein